MQPMQPIVDFQINRRNSFYSNFKQILKIIEGFSLVFLCSQFILELSSIIWFAQFTVKSYFAELNYLFNRQVSHVVTNGLGNFPAKYLSFSLNKIN